MSMLPFSSARRWSGRSQGWTVKSAEGSKAIKLIARPSAWARTMRCGATTPTPGIARSRLASPPSSSCSVGCTVSSVLVMLISVPRGTTTISAPMRENEVATPLRSAQPPVKLANPTPTASITERPSSKARSRRRPIFWAASRNSRNRWDICLTIRLPSRSAAYSSRKHAKWNDRFAGLPLTS